MASGRHIISGAPKMPPHIKPTTLYNLGFTQGHGLRIEMASLRAGGGPDGD